MKNFDHALWEISLEVLAAVVDPDHWDIVLEKIAMQVDATKASMHVHKFSKQRRDTHTAGSRLHSYGYDLSSAEDYAKHFALMDPYVPQIRKRFPSIAVGTNDDLLTEMELRNTPFFNDYGQRNGIFFVGWAVVDQTDAAASGLAVIRPEDADPFHREDIELLRRLNPLLRRAFRIQRELDQARIAVQLLLRSVAQLGIPVMALDEQRRVINLSVPASDLLDKRDGLRLRDRKLVANGAADDAELQAILKTAVQPWESKNGMQIGAVRIDRRYSDNPLLVTAFPFVVPSVSTPLSGIPFEDDRPRALVFLADQDHSNGTSRAQVLRLLFGVTDAEAKLADMLMELHGLDEVAEHAGITIGTARDRLKKLFAKTGASGQPELMKLLLSLPGLPARETP